MLSHMFTFKKSALNRPGSGELARGLAGRPVGGPRLQGAESMKIRVRSLGGPTTAGT
jgi:hypothetical protein